MEPKARVLLAEDDADQSEILAELLEQEGYEVAVARDGKALLSELARGPDLLLLDVVGVTNPAVFATLREMPSRPAVVLVSADFRLTQLAREVNADGCVAKPYELVELLDAIEAAVARRRARLERVAARP